MAVKEDDSEKVLAVDDPELKDAISTLAIGVFRTLGSRDYGRIDMRLDAQEVPNFIEANLRPGLPSHGYLSRCHYINERISHEDMILSLISLGLERAVNLPAEMEPKDSSNDADETVVSGLAVVPGV